MPGGSKAQARPNDVMPTTKGVITPYGLFEYNIKGPPESPCKYSRVMSTKINFHKIFEIVPDMYRYHFLNPWHKVVYQPIHLVVYLHPCNVRNNLY